MSGLAAQLQGELNAARKARAKDRVLLLGTMLSEIKNRAIELRRAIGAVMGKVMPRFKGRLDGGVINRIAREELGTPA